VTLTPTQAIHEIKRQGGDPIRYRLALAERFRVSVEIIDAAIAAAGSTPCAVDEETVAQERLSDERRYAKTNRADYRRWNHEEE
jgi:hypothetical protein